jgi:hypothetical protein
MSYSSTAVNYTKQDLWQLELDPTDEDLRLYTGCPYLMGGLGYNSYGQWYLEQTKYNFNKLLSFGYSNVEKKRLQILHQQYLKNSTSTKGGAWVILGGGALSSLILVVPAFAVVAFLYDFVYQTFPTGLIKTFKEIMLPLGIISFIVFNICNQILIRIHDDEGGYIFERTSGKIYWRKSETETIEMYFKDCVPYISCSHTATGTGETHDGDLYNRKLRKSIPISVRSYRDAVLTWNFLLNYMDTSKPLPDLPEFEQVRHLDPTTKAYDKKTGRDPNYWRKMGDKGARKIAKEHRELAMNWIKERQALIEKNKDRPDFKDWLKKLTQTSTTV